MVLMALCFTMAIVVFLFYPVTHPICVQYQNQQSNSDWVGKSTNKHWKGRLSIFQESLYLGISRPASAQGWHHLWSGYDTKGNSHRVQWWGMVRALVLAMWTMQNLEHSLLLWIGQTGHSVVYHSYIYRRRIALQSGSTRDAFELGTKLYSYSYPLWFCVLRWKHAALSYSNMGYPLSMWIWY